MEIGSLIRKIANKANVDLHEGRMKALSDQYDLAGYKRLYYFHIRKAGGTSLINMFLSLSGQDGAELLDELRRMADHRILSNGKIYTGWNARYITGGHYYFGFSHIPFHKLRLPDGTYTITCFRDPVKRVVSHYNMLMGFLENNIKRPCMRVEGQWLGSGFDDFLERIPKVHLMNQLYMFSETFNIDEAVGNVGNLNHYFFAEHFQEGINELNMKLGLELEPMHAHRSEHRAQIGKDTLARLREMLDCEYEFLSRIQRSPSTGR